MTRDEILSRYAAGERDFGAAYLRDADLSGANLIGANLRDADLSGASLIGASLIGANLTDANLTDANLTDANLYDANLYGASLIGASLIGASLIGANLTGAKISAFRLCPEEGEFIAWKKLRGGVLVKLRIDGKDAVSSMVGRKCRASKAYVVSGSGVSMHDESFKYTHGKTVVAKNFDPDVRVECSGGIHFWMTKKEAEDWNG